MNGLSRHMIATVGGIATSIALFSVIQSMTVERNYAPDVLTGIQDVEFVRMVDKTAEVTPRRMPKVPPPPPKNRPPPPPPMPPSHADLSGLSVALPSFNLKPQFKGGAVLSGLDLSETREVVAVSTPRPIYPTRAQRLKISGKVEVEFTVTSDGRVSAVSILNAKPKVIFDRTVLKGVARWRFKPRLENGKPVSIRIRQTIIFRPGEDR